MVGETNPELMAKLSVAFARLPNRILQCLLQLVESIETRASTDPDGKGALDVALAEFDALRAEILDNFSTARMLATVYVSGAVAVAGLVVSGRLLPDALVLIPFFGILLWWVHLDTRKIVAVIGGYIRKELTDSVRRLAKDDALFRWEDVVRDPRRGFTRWGLLFGFDGSALAFYGPPIALAFYATRKGAGAALELFKASRPGQIDVTMPSWLWLLALGFFLGELVRALRTEGIWVGAGEGDAKR